MTLDHVKCARFNSSGAPRIPAAAGQQWAAKFGWPLTVPPSSAPAGLELRGVRRCAVTDGRVAHLHLSVARRAAVGVRASRPRRSTAPSQVERFGHDSVMWSQNGRTYVVLARASRRSDLAGVVQYMRSNVY